MPAERAYSPRATWSWALYDFANSPFTTLIVTFVYATYFTEAIAADSVSGTVLWSRGITITALIVALASPFLGALADRGGYRKLFVLVATLVCAGATAALYTVLPGQIVAALVLVIVANVAFELGTVFYNAFLPDIAPPERIGTVSGWAWGLGYIGGLAALALALVTLVQPETPWFGFSTTAGENIRATNLLVAVWFLVFSLPLFIWVKEDRSRVSGAGRVVRDAYTQLRHTFTEIRKYSQIVRFLIARLVYNDGLVTIFAFGGIYAAGVFGFTLAQVLVFGIVVNAAAGAGAIAFGYLDDRIGAKLTITISLLGLIAATMLAIITTRESLFWVSGVLIGIFAGPNQAASRSLLGRFVPHEKENEFFGFFAFSGKLTAFIGPLMLGILTELSGSLRTGVSVVLVLYVVGLVLLLGVDEKAGSAARREDPARAYPGPPAA
ncbi:MFS transporter [Candidatus Rariloculus sp.]|uniref:MFS transporter n=1 Tax=Candidatus Rariloculus sp. TaxID=3101265 RepID=UPI003D0AFBC1